MEKVVGKKIEKKESKLGKDEEDTAKVYPTTTYNCSLMGVAELWHRGTVCLNRARTDLRGLRAGNRPFLPGPDEPGLKDYFKPPQCPSV